MRTLAVRCWPENLRRLGYSTQALAQALMAIFTRRRSGASVPGACRVARGGSDVISP